MVFVVRTSLKVMKKMAKTVDDQNKDDPKYKKMSNNFENL